MFVVAIMLVGIQIMLWVFVLYWMVFGACGGGGGGGGGGFVLVYGNC